MVRNIVLGSKKSVKMTLSAVRERLQERNEQLRQHGLRKQPLVVVVGNDLKSLTHHILVVDAFTYQAFFALNALYPQECEQVWLIIQRCVYGITTQFDNLSIANVNVCLRSLSATSP
ncbi:Parvalbumin beta 3 [Frankliniella fusca]|uniref:Parvalbumin beta 3 n=1 Tax=Frankliniella fusca TaxID=407009 RepID=A0AAE1LJ84_9NEOP|nr:Parvalbumin beta 3 [Frankliniella fusca]